jgi:hypothetical protein
MNRINLNKILSTSLSLALAVTSMPFSAGAAGSGVRLETHTARAVRLCGFLLLS